MTTGQARFLVRFDNCGADGGKWSQWFWSTVVRHMTKQRAMVVDNGWRDIAADMIRENRIDEALDLIYEHHRAGYLMTPVSRTTLALDGVHFSVVNHVDHDRRIVLRVLR